MTASDTICCLLLLITKHNFPGMLRLFTITIESLIAATFVFECCVTLKNHPKYLHTVNFMGGYLKDCVPITEELIAAVLYLDLPCLDSEGHL